MIDLEFDPRDFAQVASLEALVYDVQRAVDENGWYPDTSVEYEDQPTRTP